VSFIRTHSTIFAFAALTALALLPLPRLQARVQDRITQRIDNGRQAVLRGSVHPLAQAQYDQGRLSPATVLSRMVMTFSRTTAQQADLENLLREQQDPSAPSYHQWLTPEQYAGRFGLSESDLAQVTDWLQSQGFTVVETARSRTYVAFHGSVGQIDSALHTEIHRYLVHGEEHFANSAEPALPAALAGVVQGFRGLHDFRPQPRGIIVRPRFTSDISGNHYLAPDDFATIYNLQPLYGLGIDGTGQKIAVVGQSDILLSDIQTFRSVSGLPPNTPQVILVPGSGDPGVVNGDVTEASLDLEWTGAVARNATLIYVNSGNGAFDSLFYAIDQNLAPVLSNSYGDCEAHFSTADLNSMVTSGQQANAQGMTIVSASGDLGAADCDFSFNPNVTITIATKGLAVDVPASLPYVTGIGGTTLNDASGTYWSATNNSKNGSALSYIPEVVWNDTAADIANGGTFSSSGGGASIHFPKPSWQTGPGVPNDNARDVPDISLPASFDQNGYLICSQGACVNGYRDANTFLDVVGGTSAGAPAFAGMVALINQFTQSTQGNVNPRLYQLAALSPNAFHDITSGDNKVPCRAGFPNCPNGGLMGFTAGPGYDQATGVGSPNAYNLVMQWVNFALSPNPLSFGNRLPNISSTLPVTLRNNNSAVLNITGIGITGIFGQTNNCLGPLSFGSSCTINVTFLPTSLGPQSGMLTVTADDSASPHQVPISGTGADLAILLSRPTRPIRSDAKLAQPSASAVSAATLPRLASSESSRSRELPASLPALVLSALGLEFEAGAAGTQAQRGLTLRNPQSVAVMISIGIAGAFTQENDCGTELKPGASCEVTVSYRPSAPGPSRGQLKITTPAGSTSVQISGISR
jgi:subtilase family serine protease